MLKRLLVSLLILYCYSFNAAAQKENNIWVGGDNVGIDFTSGSSMVFSRPDNNNIWRTNASICDKNGNLLFYTNGYRVFNRNFQIMQNGNNLNIGDYESWGYNLLSVADGAAIIPVPGDSNKYYLFHTDLNSIHFDTFITHLMPTHLFYDVIDMNLDNGLGGILTTQKDILLLSDTLTHNGFKIIKHANGRDYWLITHEAGNNNYLRYLIDINGIHGPYLQSIGSVLDNENAFGFSPLIFGIDCSKSAQLLDYNTAVELFDFNRCTGELSNLVFFSVSDTDYFVSGGGAFSPSGRFLYITANFWNYIWQFDITASDIFQSRQLIAITDTSHNPFSIDFDKLCLAPDGKIYGCSYDGNNSLSVINYPDSAGISSGFELIGFSINPPGMGWGGTFPNQVNYSLGALPGVCDTLNQDTTILPVPEFTYGVYPNPFNNEFQISVTGAQTEPTVTVYNLLGQQLLNQKLNIKNQMANAVINMSTQPASIYIIALKVNDKTFNRKMVKQ